MKKYFTFSAGSFARVPAIEALLRSRNAIYMEFGSSACVRSEQVPLMLSELHAERANLESVRVFVVAADEKRDAKKTIGSQKQG
jgi:hypothetical protein